MKSKVKTRGLALLLASGLIASAGSIAVVSCKSGITFEKIQSRKRDTKSLIQAYTLPVESWNPAYTQMVNDSYFLSDLYAGALGIDEYGRTYGDVFESGYAGVQEDGSMGTSPYVGNSTDSFNPSLWKYKVRSNAGWYKSDGSLIRNIKASDFDNTARFILNSGNGSQVDLLWTTFINNATSMQELLSAYISAPKLQSNDVSKVLSSLKGDELSKNAYKLIANEKLKTAGDIEYKDYTQSLGDVVISISSGVEESKAKEAISSAIIAQLQKEGKTIPSDEFTITFNDGALSDGKTVADKTISVVAKSKSEIISGKLTITIGETNSEAAPVKGVVTKTTKVTEGGWGLVTDDTENTVEFHLSKPASYFETVLTYGPFSPIYDSMTSQLENGPVDAYSGAYLPKDLKSNTKTLVKNSNYHFASKTSIENITWKYLPNATSSTARLMFEAGEIDGFNVQQTDAAGWDKYIGNDSLNPTFDGVYETEPTEDFSFILDYNFYDGAIDSAAKGSEDRAYALKGSAVLQSKAARALLSTGLNRSDFVKYYSSKFDEKDATVSKNVRNFYTAPNFAINPDGKLKDATGSETGETGSKDYVQYAKETVAAKIKQINPDSKLTAASFDEGSDPLYNQSENYIANTTQADLIKQVKEFIASNTEIFGNDEKVKLSFLLNPGNSTINPYLISMFDNFNKIENNPLVIDYKTSTTAESWQSDIRAGRFHLNSSGWGPDYADPYTYLSTFTISGDYKDYTGSEKITASGTTHDVQTSAYNELVTTLKNYSDNVKKIDLGESVSADESIAAGTKEGQNTESRYQAFAEQEYNLIYRDFLMLPMYNRNTYKQYKVSYVKPYTYGHAIYGISNIKSFTLVKNSMIFDKPEYVYQVGQYKLIKEAIDTNITVGKSENILYKTVKKA